MKTIMQWVSVILFVPWFVFKTLETLFIKYGISTTTTFAKIFEVAVAVALLAIGVSIVRLTIKKQKPRKPFNPNRDERTF